MKCQICGNQLGQDEVFCGQCGKPNAVPVQSTEMMQASPPQGGSRDYSFQKGGSAFLPPAKNPAFVPEGRAFPSAISQTPQQENNFYQDATEAISLVPGASAKNYSAPSYQQQEFNGGPLTGYPGTGQFGPRVPQQPLPSGNYTNPAFPPLQPGLTHGQFGQVGYVPGTGMSLAQGRNTVMMIIGIVCLVFAIITVGTFGALFALRGGNNNQPQTPPVVRATATPTPTPTPSPTPSPIPSPTLAVSPTPTPDANYSWCTTCTANGYLVEFPNGWAQGTTKDGQGTQFTAPSQPDIYAAVKTPSGGSSANALLTADVDTFSHQPGYTPPQPAQETPIGGTNWSYQTITYQNNGQAEQVTVYATVYQGKGYVIELEALQVQFALVNSQYFSQMLARFQFVTPGQ